MFVSVRMYLSPQSDVKMRVGDKLETFAAMKNLCSFRGVGVVSLYARVELSPAMCGAETWCMREREQQKQISNCFLSMTQGAHAQANDR